MEEKKNKRIRHPKKQQEEQKEEENKEQSKHFVLEVQDGNTVNISHIGQ